MNRARGTTLRKLDLTGVTVEVSRRHPDDHKVDLRWAPYAMAEVNGHLYVVCSEGVGWDVTEDKPLRVPAYVSSPGHMALVPQHEALLDPDDVRRLATDGDIDLADLVRSFGARLEDNFWTWHARLALAE